MWVKESVMVTPRILLPYNFTTYDEKALDFVIKTFAQQKEARITLFNTYTTMPELDIKESPVLAKMRGGMVSLLAELREKEAGLKSTKGFLLENGFSDEQIDYIFKKRVKPIGDEIIETAAKGRYRVIVLSRQPGKTTRLFTRSVHNKVLSVLKDITVCIAV